MTPRQISSSVLRKSRGVLDRAAATACVGVTLGLILCSCATVESSLNEGQVFGACQLATEGQWPFYESDFDGAQKVQDAVAAGTRVEVELLDFADTQFLGETFQDPSLALVKFRVTLPEGTRAPYFDTFESTELTEKRVARGLPALVMPVAEVVPPGPLVIPPPPKNPPYKPPKGSGRRRGGLIDAFVSLVTLPATLIRAGVEATVAIVRIPFDIANSVLGGGAVRVGSPQTFDASTPKTHTAPMFQDVLLNETEWRDVVDEAAARYAIKMRGYEAAVADREARLKTLFAATRAPCELNRERTCEVLRILDRTQRRTSIWVSPQLYPDEATARQGRPEAVCALPAISFAYEIPPAPVETATASASSAPVAAKPVAASRPKAPPAFLYGGEPPQIERAFAEAKIGKVSGLAGETLVCRVDVKRPNCWNEPIAPDPIVRLAWGKYDVTGTTIDGPENAKRFHFLARDVVAGIGDRFRITLGDRDGSDVEYMGISVVDFDGMLPLVFDVDSYRAECRALTSSAIERRAAPVVQAAERRLTRLSDRVESAKMTLDGETFPTESLTRVDAELRNVAAWLGFHHPTIESLLETRAKARARFDARVIEFRKAQRLAAKPLERPLEVAYGFQIREVKTLCGPTEESRRGLEFFLARHERARLQNECLTFFVVERTQDRTNSVSRLQGLDLEIVRADGTTRDRDVELVGDAKGWFTFKSLSLGSRVVMLAVLSAPGEDVVFLHAGKRMIRAVESDETSLDPVVLGATPTATPSQ